MLNELNEMNELYRTKKKDSVLSEEIKKKLVRRIKIKTQDVISHDFLKHEHESRYVIIEIKIKTTKNIIFKKKKIVCDTKQTSYNEF